MKKENRRRIRNILVFALITLLLITGISYAYINFSVEGTKTNLIKAGCLKFDFIETKGLSLGNSAPMGDKAGLQTEPYTFTITNTCTSTAHYKTVLNVLADSNIENLSKVKIALSGDTNILPSLVSSFQEIVLQEGQEEGTKNYLIDSGYLAVGETKTFDLRMWIDYEATEFDGLFNSQIVVEAVAKEGPSYSSSTAGYKVLENNEVVDMNPNYTNPSNEENGLFKYPTETNPIYYFRGNVDNNYIKFGKYSEDVNISYIDASGTEQIITHKKGEDIIWRIVRVNDDASITIVLNDLIGMSNYSNTTTQNSVNYNDLSNLIKTTSEAWYQKHLSGSSKYIVDNGFCGDAKLEEDSKHYQGYIRNITNGTPSLVCSSDNLYTVTNGKLTNPIGLLTADELTLAGASYNKANTTYYLYDATKGFYTMTPGYFENEAYMIGSNNQENKSLTTILTNTSLGIKPVIHLSKDVILSGNGTLNNKYTVEGLYSEGIEKKADKKAPIITSLYVSKDWSKENKKIAVTASEEDGGSGIQAYYVSTKNETPAIAANEWVTTTEEKFETTDAYDNGTYYVFVKDKNGNISSSKSVTIKNIDKENPTCSISIDPDGVHSVIKTLTIVATDDNMATNGYSWDGTEYSTFKEQIISSNNVYNAYVKDLAGNIGTCNVTVTSIKNDFSAPYITSVTMVSNNEAKNYAKAGNTVTLTTTISETLKTDPTITANGNTLTLNKTVNEDGTVTYTSTMNITDSTPLGGIKLEISGYKDEADNEGPKYVSSNLVTVYKLSGWSGLTTTACTVGELCQSTTAYQTRTKTHTGTSCGAWSGYTTSACSVDGVNCTSTPGYANYNYIGAASPYVCTTYTCYQQNMTANGCYNNGGSLDANGTTCYKYDQTSCSGNWKYYQTFTNTCYKCTSGTRIWSGDYGKYMCYSTSSAYFSHYGTGNYGYYGVNTTLYQTCTSYSYSYSYSAWSNPTTTACSVNGDTCQQVTAYQTRTRITQ